MLKAAVPQIHVSTSAAAKHFYSDKLREFLAAE